MEEGGGNPLAPPDVETVDVYGAAVIDRGLPGRLFRGVKRCWGMRVRRLMVFDSPFRLVALVTPFFLGCDLLRRSCPVKASFLDRPSVLFEGDHTAATPLP